MKYMLVIIFSLLIVLFIWSFEQFIHQAIVCDGGLIKGFDIHYPLSRHICVKDFGNINR